MLEIMPYPKVFSVYFSQKDQTIFISNQYQVASEGLAAFSPVASDAMLTTVSWRHLHPASSCRSCDDTSAITQHACGKWNRTLEGNNDREDEFMKTLLTMHCFQVSLKRETYVLRYTLYLCIPSQIGVDFCQTNNNNNKKELHTKTASKNRMWTHTFRKCHKHWFPSKIKANNLKMSKQ